MLLLHSPIFRLRTYVKVLATHFFSGHLSYTSILFKKWMNIWIMDYTLICTQNAFYIFYWSMIFLLENHLYATKIKVNASFAYWIVSTHYIPIYSRGKKRFYPLKEPLHFLFDKHNLDFCESYFRLAEIHAE